MLLKSTPLIVIALGLAVCYRSNVWNIGAEGQFLLGAVAAGGLALWITTAGIHAPRWVWTPLILLGEQVMEGVFMRIDDPRYGSLVSAALMFGHDQRPVERPPDLHAADDLGRPLGDGRGQPAQQVAAGRAHVRVNLAATAAGLALHPNEQALQEYAEVAVPYRALHELLDAPAPRFASRRSARSSPAHLA